MNRSLSSFVFAVLVCCCFTAYSHADDNVYVYHQKTGKLTLGKTEIAKGYSGFGAGKNKPEKQNVKDVGPIPEGTYKIGKSRIYNKMDNCFDLTPVGHDALGRTEFLIHGDNKDGTASKGCVILDSATRKIIADSKITQFKVVKD